MKRMNQVITNKMILQADEAKIVGLSKLSETVYDAVAGMQIQPEEEVFNRDELEDLVKAALWKAACGVVAYHDLQSVDIQKIDQVVAVAADGFVKEVEQQLDVSDKVGHFETILPGEQKR